jgi:hypothetical protein
MQVLITGSREASPAMLAKVDEVIFWCKTEGHQVLVGDAPGVDRHVRKLCASFGMTARVFGAHDTICDPEIGATTEQLVKLGGTYPERDRVMAQACDLCVAVWNGTSRGTKITFEAAQRIGKRVILRKFD